MQEVGLEQKDATILFEENNGPLMMANAQQPTKYMQHIDIKHFMLLDWVEQDMLILEHIQTNNNVADAMTKTLSKNLFYRHYDTYMGRRIPDYCNTKQQRLPTSQTYAQEKKPKSAPCGTPNTDPSSEHGGY
jgi:hypothetical protein